MRILVIDDNPKHQEAARLQLGTSHDVVIADNYDDAQFALGYENFFQRTDKHTFDVVLADLLMPASDQCLNNNSGKFAGQEMPVGIFLALLAAKNGARYVGLLTDSNHHDHPASAAIDAFNPHENKPTVFQVAGAKVALVNGSKFLRFVNPSNLAEETTDYSNYTLVKNWEELLRVLTT